MKLTILTATVLAVASSAWLGFVAGQAHPKKPDITPGFWIGIDPETPRLIGIINTTDRPGTDFRASMQRFPLNNGWIVTLNAYGGTSGRVTIETNVPVAQSTHRLP